MTYREKYAQFVKHQRQVAAVHLVNCPGALRDLGIKVPDSKQLGCPYNDCTLPDDFAPVCAACWDSEMEVLK